MTTSAQVVVVGAGPAGLTLANLLQQAGVSAVLLETESRSAIEQRPRAGFIEDWVVRALDRHGLAGRLLSTAQIHRKFEFRLGGERHVVNYGQLSGGAHYVYPQQELVTDLVAAFTDSGGDARFEVDDVALHGLAGQPSVTYRDARTGARQRIGCDLVAGCDGARGVSRRSAPEGAFAEFRHHYGVGWLALLAETPPSADRVVFGIHARGFAAHMPRTSTVTRFYLQCPPGDDPASWPDERVWEELHTRLAVPGDGLTEGRLLEKRVLDMHNSVVEPMSYGRLYLAGESAHVVAPIGAKGMNLAIHDALQLASRIIDRCRNGDEAALDDYSAACLPRVWQYQEFSHWLSDIFHGSTRLTSGEPFLGRLADARLQRLLRSPSDAIAFTKMYVGSTDGVGGVDSTDGRHGGDGTALS
ncbi:MAG: 4-hydroxybenzoate 3-monooxygenase [Streptomycetales bacterium]